MFSRYFQPERHSVVDPDLSGLEVGGYLRADSRDSMEVKRRAELWSPELEQETKRELHSAKVRIEERLSNIGKTLAENEDMLQSSKRFAAKFQLASGGGKI